MTALLELEHVARRYGPADGPGAMHVLRDVCLQLPAGATLAVVGPSGCGKSTLLNIIGGLDAPTAGRVLLEGRDLAAMGEAELAAVRGRQIGFVFQLHHLLPQCTLLENVLVPTLIREPAVRAEARERAMTLLKAAGLEECAARRPGQVSIGQRQRAAVVRALINRPRLLLADEPTGSLDRAAAEGVADLLAELNRAEGVAMIVVTHSPAIARRMHEVRELRDGTLAQWSGEP